MVTYEIAPSPSTTTNLHNEIALLRNYAKSESGVVPMEVVASHQTDKDNRAKIASVSRLFPDSCAFIGARFSWLSGLFGFHRLSWLFVDFHVSA